MSLDAVGPASSWLRRARVQLAPRPSRVNALEHRGGDLVQASSDDVERDALAEQVCLDTEAGGDRDVQMQSDRFGDEACTVLACRSVEQVVSGARSLDREALRVIVATPVRWRQSEVVQHARQVEQLAVVFRAVALREKLGESPRPGAVSVERRARKLADVFLGLAGEAAVGRLWQIE